MTTKQIKIDLRGYLLAATAVTDEIGQRLYATLAPASPVRPYAVYSLISDVPEYTHGCSDESEEESRELVFQVDVLGETAADVEDAGAAIRTRVEGKKFTEGSTDFGAVFVDSEFDNFDDVAGSDGLSGLFRKTLQIRTEINV